ncbi:Uncharacterised protein [Serratia fonticola]|nr:Uncharacterised protein [Serratia fonticola]
MAPIASYLPESQIITLSKDFPALDDPNELKGFITPVQLGIFFHEWIHFLHNVSTFNGLSSFSIQVVLWSNFRLTMNEQGVSIGSEEIALDKVGYNKNFISYLYSNRKKNKGFLPAQAQPNELSFKNIELLDSVVVDGEVIGISIIKCEVDYGGNIYDIDIGTFEILESVAFMLESKLILEMNGVPEKAPICPYHLVEGLATEISPSLDKDIIICCMLASLQTNDPPSLLFTLLKDAESLHESCRHDELINYVQNNLKRQLQTIDAQLKQIRLMFPVDEPMGAFVKLTLDRIESNLVYRMQNPFFELSIIDEISKQANNFNQVIRRYGGCTIIQQRPGDEDDINRDVMYDFVIPGQDDTVSFGWKMAHASFQFASKHFNLLGEIKKSDALQYKCPFYTVCGSSVRLSNSNICAESPWQARHIEDNNDCYYSSAIKATSPPPKSQVFLLNKASAEE